MRDHLGLYICHLERREKLARDDVAIARKATPGPAGDRYRYNREHSGKRAGRRGLEWNRREERALSPVDIGLVVFLGIYAIVVIVLYGRQRRWYATGGWILIAGGIIALAAGLGSRFAWGGLVFLFIIALGCLMVIIDVVGELRRKRR